MKGFQTPLDLRAHKVPGHWVLLRPLIYHALDGRRVRVPAGFITDLASIPAILRPVFSQNDRTRRPAVLHDFLYCSQVMTRAQVDGIFLEAMMVEGVGWARRWVMFTGVRVGGWMFWKGHIGLTDNDFADL